MEKLGDYENAYIERLFFEHQELFKQKIDLVSRLVVNQKHIEILNRDINDVATRFHQLKNMYDSLLIEHENLQAEETVKAKKGAK